MCIIWKLQLDIYIYICKEYNGFKTEQKNIEHPGLQGQHPSDNLNLANGFGIILSDKSVKWMVDVTI